MVKKIKSSSIRKKRNQINQINNNHSLVNVNELKLQSENTFWVGLMVGVVGGIFTTFWLMSDKSEKKETNC